MKRLILIIAIIVVVLGLVIGGLILRSQSDGTPDPNTGGTPSGQLPGTLPGFGGGGGGTPDGGLLPSEINILSSEPIRSYFAFTKDHWVGVQEDGKIIEIQNGQLDTLSSTEIDNLIEASFSFDGKRVLAIFGDNLKPQVSVFNMETESWEPILASFNSADWAPSDYRVVYSIKKSGGLAIVTLDLAPSKATPRELLRIGAHDLVLDWVSPSQILIMDKPTAQTASSIWSLDIGSKKLTELMTEVAGRVLRWDAKGEVGLILKSSGQRGGSLSILNKKGEDVQNLNFLTLPSKCVFSEELTEDVDGKMVVTDTFLNCAVPRDSQALSNSVLPDDYLKKALTTSDSFFRISMDDGSVTTISADQNKFFDAQSLSVTEGSLFFINRSDRKLYSISL